MEEFFHFIDWHSGGGSPGTGGDGSTGNNSASGGAGNNNQNPPSNYNPQDPAIHGNQGPIITAPVFEEVPPNPCQLVSVLKSDNVFKQKMVALKNAAQQWSLELLFTVYDDPNPNSQVSQIYNYNYSEFMGTVNNPSASWTGNQTMKGMIHSHYNGLLSVFSPQDLKQLYELMLNTAITNDFFFGVVTHSGSSYILQIKDRATFISFGNKYLSTENKFRRFEIDMYNKKYNIKEGNSNTTNENGFVKMFSDLNSGINIYKATDLTFTNYDKLVYGNNQTISQPCN